MISNDLEFSIIQENFNKDEENFNKSKEFFVFAVDNGSGVFYNVTNRTPHTYDLATSYVKKGGTFFLVFRRW